MTVADLDTYRAEQARRTLAALRAAAEQAATEDEAREVALRIRTFVRRLRASRWEPYVWQRPHHHPPGWVSERDPRLGVCDDRCADLPPAVPQTHEVWVQRGGRGTGKTDGAAHYINEHAEGPPCDPRVPGGHRFTIVGPTQPDAVSSCVTGVSGLQAINPAITVTTGKEGTLVRWPNGSVGRILGANTAQDVQRARAWSNVCVAEGSLVQTERGPVPVEEVQVGDRVWTRTGLRPVVRAEQTGVRPVVRVQAEGADVWVTPDHPVARPDGTFSRADAGGTVLVWLEQPSSTTDTPGPVEMTATTGGAAGSSTGTSTPVKSDRSRTGTTPRNGTPQGAARLPLPALSVPTPASAAGPCSSTGTAPRPSSAPPTARTVEPRHEHQRTACAACVAAGSPAHAGTRPAPVARPAAVSPPTRHAKVYDLAVDGHHEFYAGGVLVGNCVWWLEEFAAMPHAGGLVGTPGYTGPPGMLDQAPFTLRLHAPGAPRFPHIVATTTPTGRPEVEALLDRPGFQTWGRTRDAYNLDPAVREALEILYPPGTTIARQELDGERVGDVAGALWIQSRAGAAADDERPGIDDDRVPLGSVGWTPHGNVHDLPVPEDPETAATFHRLLALLPAVPDAPTLTVDRTVIGVDPAGGATENGISAVGAAHGHGYTLADLSLTGGPKAWGMLAVLAWYHFGAEGIAMERTYGGDQTDHVIATAADVLGLPLPAALRAPTVDGKKQRAIPVQTLAQVHRIHHVGQFPKLEGEQTTWVEDETPESPNRLDAWVHACRHLLVRAKQGTVNRPTSTRRARTTGSTWAGGTSGRRR